MAEKENFIKCPECGADIDVNEVLYHQLEEKIKKSYEEKSSKRDKEIKKQLKHIQTEKEQLERQKESLDDHISREVQLKIKTEKNKLEKSIREQLQDETSEQIKELQKELEQKSSQVKELNKTKAEVEKLRREKDELRDQVALEKEKEFSEKLKDERQKIKKQSAEENILKIKELEKKLEDQTRLAEEMKRKAEQGSMQLQGEIQELELENILREMYPFDEIREIKKGQRGADIIQVVRTNQGNDCGKIYYESKRTKNFDYGWLQKLRDDNLDVKADVLVIVTEAMPSDTEHKYFHKDGVWVCSFWEIKSFSLVLRQGLLQIQAVAVTQHGKETKMELLYDFLTSQEFRGQFEAIIEGFKSLQDSYSDEKLKMQKIWKEREKQLEKILTNAVNFYGSLKGIAGASIPDIKMLESGDDNLLTDIKTLKI
ncbi:MAG: DUF2130 domain-containing protein [Deltaproteobacteria bacterium]|nr:DUF2130 domain-containing protein [Deltaproteobacteria bacterium]